MDVRASCVTEVVYASKYILMPLVVAINWNACGNEESALVTEVGTWNQTDHMQIRHRELPHGGADLFLDLGLTQRPVLSTAHVGTACNARKCMMNFHSKDPKQWFMADGALAFAGTWCMVDRKFGNHSAGTEDSSPMPWDRQSKWLSELGKIRSRTGQNGKVEIKRSTAHPNRWECFSAPSWKDRDLSRRVDFADSLYYKVHDSHNHEHPHAGQYGAGSFQLIALDFRCSSSEMSELPISRFARLVLPMLAYLNCVSETYICCSASMVPDVEALAAVNLPSVGGANPSAFSSFGGNLSETMKLVPLDCEEDSSMHFAPIQDLFHSTSCGWNLARNQAVMRIPTVASQLSNSFRPQCHFR
ncbi:hypothetical protein BJ508DRAFT_375031 [Ascobolus immersus RN42]|uniref:Uncharacterized protein n=1 Tax=Ascobolus immersus RN42 TaxID=1160509 RepID=A0A3N4IBM9_ASCIM|nr:hypothetical protein BJ508DRAFT_375031 [Ascobolus immersus RN42]